MITRVPLNRCIRVIVAGLLFRVPLARYFYMSSYIAPLLAIEAVKVYTSGRKGDSYHPLKIHVSQYHAIIMGTFLCTLRFEWATFPCGPLLAHNNNTRHSLSINLKNYKISWIIGNYIIPFHVAHFCFLAHLSMWPITIANKLMQITSRQD